MYFAAANLFFGSKTLMNVNRLQFLPGFSTFKVTPSYLSPLTEPSHTEVSENCVRKVLGVEIADLTKFSATEAQIRIKKNKPQMSKLKL